MKPSFVLLSIALLLSSSLSHASDFGSPSHPPVMSPTPEPSNSIDCSSVIYSMVDCLSFLTVGSTDPSPTKTCCVGIKTVLEYNPKCLCSALESSRAMGFVLDDTKALAMPKICNVPIDPHCVSPPVEPPTTSPPSAKSPAMTPSSPAVSHSPPPVSHSPPPVRHSPPPVRHSPPPVRHSSPVEAASSPLKAVSSSTAIASSPMAASPSPSPSISSTGILSVSKQFLAAVMVSSFVYIFA
ncbi:non-specific lipid-transfer protein-like protein At5g64080 isoform X1 [Arabidopsis lyrata subsp. lyrata]|uniref:non-specific lipid-transfer protein-like protein At5g64080 isoform X1 n=1 Tax=Arabidopsis lyrata subsp. lyrata TaxID=81972 RepID=UPI000A29C075|nr:non-specific lipid-transfer protein-like protein At5g64080 isoform X1 [Arabidopsis lyrata subsp. lyrata]|eukprot:XP_020869501.1 non-specific lipid-transfer protein-like protein At5g64080 isoform X1 [Arabidopsis lyrata subsp. lyrata]